MKKLTALVLLAACPAFAASNVTLFGKIDESIMVNKMKGTSARVTEETGFTGASRWGIKGTEDLGNGYKVGFILESQFNIDDGAGDGNAFGREAALIVDGGFGKLTFGRLGTLGFAQTTSIRTGWVFGVTHGGSKLTSTLKQSMARASNAIAYSTPSFSGLTLHAMYSNGMKEDTAKWKDNNHYYGIGAKYVGSGITSSLIFESQDNRAENKAKQPNWNLLTFGFQYDAKVITPMFFYQYSWKDKYFKQNTFGLSAKMPLAGGNLSFGAKYIFAKNEGTESYAKNSTYKKGSILNFGAKYDYRLSKRTQVYAYAGCNTARKAFDDKALIAKENYKYGYLYSGWQAVVGMVHDF